MIASMTKKQISASTVDEANHLLGAAVNELQRHAGQECAHGILVTKTGPGQFTVEFSERVPFGITEEAVA
jgi:hypothetical protein